MRQRKIVVVEDERNILEVIAHNLKREGFQVDTAMDGDAGLSCIRQCQPDLVILDVMLPGLDGIEICKRIKADSRLRDIPVLMLTARTEESDIVLGLGVGADDYISKPFSPRELIARVKAALRRGPLVETRQALTQIAAGNLVIDLERHEVTVDGCQIGLTPSEFHILHRLAAAPGRTFGREELLDAVSSGSALVLERNVDAHIKSLRKKLGTARELLETVRGVGYRFRDTMRSR